MRQGEKITQTLGQSAHERLREMILGGELSAGTRLQEKTFADRLGVSRTPVREAIALLISEGLVTRSSGGVPTVNSISITDFMEILHVRRLLECEIRAAGGKREFARRTPCFIAKACRRLSGRPATDRSRTHAP